MSNPEEEKSVENVEQPNYDDVSKYNDFSRIGQGAFGEVFKARLTEESEFVALKKVFIIKKDPDEKSKRMREIEILQDLHHENVVKLIEVCSSTADLIDKYKRTLYLVFELCDIDLARFLANEKAKLSLGEIKQVFQQFFNGLHYMHNNKIVHRDLKPSNILLTNKGVLKIADFGTARKISDQSDQPDGYTNRVGTLWYRAPELLLGGTRYCSQVDMWAAGCILVEMWKRKPLMLGSCEQQQIKFISQLCGSITPEVWPGVENLELYKKLNLPEGQERMAKEFVKKYVDDELACDLIDKLYTLDPSQRPNAEEALQHDFFKMDPMPCDFAATVTQYSQREDTDTATHSMSKRMKKGVQ